jgi:hypothetical protein
MAVKMDYDVYFNMDDSFSLSSRSMGCLATSTNFSAASSTYDPFTPHSGRSTPQKSFDSSFDSSFSSCASSISFDLTPPPTAMSGYFAVAVEAECNPMYTFNRRLKTPPVPLTQKPPVPMGSTEVDYHAMLEVTLPQSCMVSATPARSLNDCSLGEHRNPPFISQTPGASFSGSAAEGYSGIWPCSSDSPLSFFVKQESQSSSRIRPLRGSVSPNSYSLATAPLTSRKRFFVNDAQKKTTALHTAQRNLTATRAKREKLKSKHAPNSGSHIEKIPLAKFKCEYEGCKSAYRRAEHLKRHISG